MAGRASGGQSQGITSGRDREYVPPTFHENERNTYLFRSLFLFAYIGIGIDIVEGFIGIPINTLLNKSSHPITDEHVRKMIWLILNFKRILERDDSVYVLTHFNSEWIRVQGTFMKVANIGQQQQQQQQQQQIQISESISTLTVRVFAWFQRENLTPGIESRMVFNQAEKEADVQNELEIQSDPEITSAVASADYAVTVPMRETADTAIIQEIVSEQNTDRRFTSPRLAARAEAAKKAAEQEQAQAAARAAAARAAAAAAAAEARIKLEEYTKNLRSTILKRFPNSNSQILTNRQYVANCNVSLFYKSLPILMMRMKTCLPVLLNNKDVSKEPGSVGTLVGLGLIERGGGVGARDLFEHKDPIPQCNNTVGNYHNYVNPNCYICGQVWIEGSQDSMECEHILCVIHAIEYFGLLQSVFFSVNQKRFLSMLYAWAHRCCNQRKGNIAFIRKNQNVVPARGNHFVPDDVNIRKLIDDIFMSSRTGQNQKLDCPAVLKKVTDKQKFVKERTIAVTSYVTPLVDCINTVYNSLFEKNMMLFNAVGCLKKIAELCIHITSSSQITDTYYIDFGKTHECMDVLFPGYFSQPSGRGGANHRSVSDSKNKSKSLRHKIQHGGALDTRDKALIVRSIHSVVQQKVDNIFLERFNDKLEQILEGDPLHPSPLPPLPPPPPFPPPIEGQEQVESPELNKLLFILFILNHYRNPDVLFSLFFQPTIRLARQQIQQNTANREAFVYIFNNIFPDIVTITPFLHDYDMIPSFMGVFNLCLRMPGVVNSVNMANQAVIDSVRGLAQPLQNQVFRPVFEQFAGLCNKLWDFSINPDFLEKIREKIHSGGSTPLDHLAMACYHLKTCLEEEERAAAAERSGAGSGTGEEAGTGSAMVDSRAKSVEKAVNMLKSACDLFPQCYNSDLDNPGQLFSYFGPCNVYPPGSLLENHNFQSAMGFFALVKNTKELFKPRMLQQVDTPELYTQALHICTDFFPEYESMLIESVELSQGSTPSPPPQRSLSSSKTTQKEKRPTDYLDLAVEQIQKKTAQQQIVRGNPTVSPAGGSSTLRRKLRHNHRRTQYTNKHKRSSKTTNRATIKHHKSYRKHNRTIKRSKNSRRK